VQARTSPSGATLPASNTRFAPSASHAFWCERITYSSLIAGDIADVARHSASNPAEAIRSIRVAVRTLASALPPIERHRALSWTDEGGCLGAIAALHRGEPCGFSVSSGRNWVEWTVRPFLDFRVSDEALLPILPPPSCRTPPDHTPVLSTLTGDLCPRPRTN
jgi:hypothetical protein